MRTEYKRDMNHNYLILYGENEIDTGSYQVRMLAGNVIPSLLKCRIQGVDGTFMLYYDVTSRQSLLSAYEGKKLKLEDLRLIFGGFVKVMEDTAEYLIDPGQLLIAPEYIFVEMESRQIYFCLMPGMEKDIRNQFLALTEYILPQIDHEEKAAVMLGYGVYRRSMEDSFHLEHVKEELYRVKEEHTEDKNSDEFLQDMERETGFFPEEENDRDLFFREREERTGKRKKAEVADHIIRTGTGKQAENRMSAVMGKIAVMMGCLLGAALLFLLEYLGYLPYIQMEILLGGIVILMGIAMAVTLVVEKKKQREQKKQEEQKEQRKRRQTLYEKRLEQEPGQQKNGDANTQDKKTPKQDEEWDRDFREKEMEIQKNDPQSSGKTKQNGLLKNLKQNGNSQDYFGETMVLSMNVQAGPASLVSREPGELATIYLNEELTVIGKLENACDAVIDLPTVSRVHAKVRKREEEYYLTDLNSRNGTSVNGRLLRPEEEYLLQAEDEVDFAQARYIFLK